MSLNRIGLLLFFPLTVLAEADKPLTPKEARDQVGKMITVRLKVATTKDRLEKRGEIYLDSEEDFKSPTNFAVVITRAGAQQLRDAGIDQPAEYFKGRQIEVKGTVQIVEEVPRIAVDEAKQIRRIEPDFPTK